MITINGTKAEPTDTYIAEKQKNVLSIKQVLASMQQNYDNVNLGKAQSLKNDDADDSNGMFNMLTNGKDKNELLMSLLPLLLSKNKTGIDSLSAGENDIMQNLLKSTRNPMLSKILELIPKFKNLSSKGTKKQEYVKPVNDSPKIDSFIKTSEYKI